MPPAPAPPGTERLRGLTLPGLANAHSHAFHRALRGITEAGPGTFWTWRERMYQVAGRLAPDSYLELARAAYAEMALAGVTWWGSSLPAPRPGGSPTPTRTRWAVPSSRPRPRLACGSRCWTRATSLAGWPRTGHPSRCRRCSSGSATGTRRGGRTGWPRSAPTSTGCSRRTPGPGGHPLGARRAARPDAPGLDWSHRLGAPLHAHLSEQPAENEACLAAYGTTPARVLDEAGALGPRSTMVHATHLTRHDIDLLGGSRTCVCLCPTTEAFLANGIGPAGALAAAGRPSRWAATVTR